MFVSVYVTAPTMAEAEKLARRALDLRLAACANAFPLQSWYWWRGKVEHATEVGLLLKTRKELLPDLVEELKAAHSYDVPCIVAWPIVDGNAEYLAWVEAETRAAGDAP